MTTLTPFCPRCGGRMIPGSDLHGEYASCLNCGFYQDVTVGPPVELKAAWRGGQVPHSQKGKVKR